jgi:hypothetical protein
VFFFLANYSQISTFFLNAATGTKEKKGGQMMKVRWKAFGDGRDGPKDSQTTVPIRLSKP